MTKDYQVLYIHPRKMEIHGNIQYLWKTKDCQILYIHLHKRKKKINENHFSVYTIKN